MSSPLPSQPFYALLPLRGLVVTLRCLSSAHLAFFHQPALTAFLRFLVGSPEHYDQQIRLDTPESGRIRYRQGDYYRFVLIGLAGSEALLDTLIQQLAALPHSAPKQGLELPFRDNWQLVNIQDLFTHQTVHSLQQVTLYDTAALQAEAALWQGKLSVRWQWFTPALLLKAKQQREAQQAKGAERYVRDASDLEATLLLSRLHNTVADLLRRQDSVRQMTLQALPAVQIQAVHLFWLEAGYRGKQRDYKDMGGVSGYVHLLLPADLPAMWWELVVLGQYLGIGQRTTFGWGRYGLVDSEGWQSYRRVFPASSLLTLAQDEDNLSRAWRHVMAGRDLPPSWVEEASLEQDNLLALPESEEFPSEIEGELTETLPLERLQADLERLLNAQYSIPVLQGYLLPKKNGGVRPLAIPPPYDRVLQRAVQQVLGEALESLLSPHSYGYRVGRSRLNASQAIQQAWREGYRWVYESDIQDFFDSVEFPRLRDRLQAIYGSDPVVSAVMAWMQAAVTFQQEHLLRVRGLPQGSALSPLMAKLMLDDLLGLSEEGSADFPLVVII